MKTLNEITQRLDGTNYDTYKLSDLIDSIDEMTPGEISSLKERLEYLESADLEYDESEFDEKLKLRSMFS